MTRIPPLACAWLVALLACSTPASAGDASKPAGEVVAATKLESLDAPPKTLAAAVDGKVTLLYFWATWCIPCRAELPRLIELDDALKARGLRVVGVAIDKADKVRAFVDEKHITYPIFFGNQDAVALGRALGNDTGGIPYTVIIGKDGKLVRAFSGDLPGDEVRKLLESLLG